MACNGMELKLGFLLLLLLVQQLPATSAVIAAVVDAEAAAAIVVADDANVIADAVWIKFAKMHDCSHGNHLWALLLGYKAACALPGLKYESICGREKMSYSHPGDCRETDSLTETRWTEDRQT